MKVWKDYTTKDGIIIEKAIKAIKAYWRKLSRCAYLHKIYSRGNCERDCLYGKKERGGWVKGFKIQILEV